MIEHVPQLTVAAARAMADAALAQAARDGCAVVVAVVDAGGHLLLLERGPGAAVSSVEVAHRKARSAALYGFPTEVAEQAVQSMPSMLTLPDMLPFAGGLPVRHDGRIAGAVGVSGGTAAQDIACAEAALATLESASRS